MPITVATWNVNGIRARAGEVLALVERVRPDVLCLQEVRAATTLVPADLRELPGYTGVWHAGGGYSGVALHVRRDRWPDPLVFAPPAFDVEHRVVAVDLGACRVASVYVPNGRRDFAAKLAFLEALVAWVAEARTAGRTLLLLGDLNVTRTDADVHPKERDPRALGQRPEERARLEALLAAGLVDVGRALDPENDRLYTWWAPWRQHRQRNIGWRLDYVLAGAELASRAVRCAVLADHGTSDHAPVVATFD